MAKRLQPLARLELLGIGFEVRNAIASDDFIDSIVLLILLILLILSILLILLFRFC